MIDQTGFESRLAITPAERERRKEFSGFTDEDAHLLSAMRGKDIDDLYVQNVTSCLMLMGLN
jgi:hypothetical protein